MALHPARAARALRAASIAAWFAAAALSACGIPSAEPVAGGVDLRVIVKLARPSADRVVIAAEATREAGVPASYAASVSATWHALSLHCESAAACEAAITRMRQARGVYESVELDGRKQRAVM